METAKNINMNEKNIKYKKLQQYFTVKKRYGGWSELCRLVHQLETGMNGISLAKM